MELRTQITFLDLVHFFQILTPTTTPPCALGSCPGKVHPAWGALFRKPACHFFFLEVSYFQSSTAAGGVILVSYTHRE